MTDTEILNWIEAHGFIVKRLGDPGAWVVWSMRGYPYTHPILREAVKLAMDEK